DEWGFADRSRRGLGTSALFAGPSGTGKTMAAEVVAGELALDLWRIDLSTVVSKYIGETEKNLRRVFDAAELGGPVPLFDQAGASIQNIATQAAFLAANDGTARDHQLKMRHVRQAARIELAKLKVPFDNRWVWR